MLSVSIIINFTFVTTVRDHFIELNLGLLAHGLRTAYTTLRYSLECLI